MKKFILGVVLFFMAGCSYNMLTSDVKPIQRQVGPLALTCAVINEWNVSAVEKDYKVGCWCMLPPSKAMGATGVFFLFVADEFCNEKIAQKELEKM